MPVFTKHERETIEAAMARIIPTDHDPGAREARTIEFLERYLSGPDAIYAKADGRGFVPLGEQLRRVWSERIEGLRRQYVDGVAELDSRARARFGNDFIELSEEQQDTILVELERGLRAEEGAHDARLLESADKPQQQPLLEQGLDFFPLLVLHTRQGFYSDPAYGGNRDGVGWKTIGFPGPHSLADAASGAWSTIPYFVSADEA